MTTSFAELLSAFFTQLLLGLVSNSFILWILGLATIIGVLDANGFLPPRFARWLARNKLENTLIALKKLGVRIVWDEENRAISLTDRLLDSTGIRELAYKSELRSMLEEDTFKGPMEIGETTFYSQEEFIDVMGASTDPHRATKYARIMHTHLMVNPIEFDVVATPRTGSPLLGYEFARLSRKPFVLGTYVKVNDTKHVMGIHSSLDFPKMLDLKDKKVLLVDDSTTGGRKLADLAAQLKGANATVTNSLVLFEPIGKGAREKLMASNITLHAIQDGANGSF